jgi:hypothetical protein
VGVCFVLHRFQMRGIVDESVISRISLDNNESGGNFTNMLRIILKPATLNTAERAAIADFIVNYPSAEIEQPAEIPAFAEYVEADDADEAPDEVFTPAHATPAVAPTGVTLDTAGLPWDARIHTGSRAMNADGSWRRKRGVDEATIATVEGELKALMSVPVEPASNVLPFTPAPSVHIETSPIPEVAQASAVPAPPPPPPTDPFIGLIERISSLVGAKAITMEQAQAAIVAAGGVSLPLMVSRPDLIPQVLSAINALVTAA